MAVPRGINPPAPMELAGLSVLDVMTEPGLFGAQFGGESWAAWRTVMKAIAGLPLDSPDLPVYRHCTNRRKPPTGPAREAWLICGRRAGKSQMAALWALYAACFRTYRLAIGETGTVMVVTADRRQAQVVFGYIRGLLRSLPMLADLIARETSETIDLTNGIMIQIATASYRTIRGFTVVAAVCDEIAYWREEGSNSDREILTALKPALSTTNGLLLTLTTPYGRRGVAGREAAA